MNKFYDHPKFIDVRLEVREPVRYTDRYVNVKAVWWMKRWGLPFVTEDMQVERDLWEKFEKECNRTQQYDS